MKGMNMEYSMEERLDQFGVADEDGVIVLDRVAEKKSLINRGVYLLNEMETLKEDLKALLEEGKDKGYDKKNLKALIDNTFNNQLDDKIEELESIRTELSNLFESED